MRSLSPARTRLVAVSATLALLLAACGGDDDATGSTTAPPVTTAAATTDAPAVAPPAIQVPVADGADAESSGDAMPGTDIRLAYIEYELDAELPALDSPAPAWVLRPGPMDAAALAAVAAALGIDGEVVHQSPEEGGAWVVGPADGSGPAVWAYEDATRSWWMSAGPTTATAGCVMPEQSTGSGEDGSPPDAGADDSPGADDSGSTGGGSAPNTGSAGASTPGDPDGTNPDGAGQNGSDEKPVDDAPADDAPTGCVMPDPPSGVPTAEEAEALAAALLTDLGVDATSVEWESYADDWGASVTAYLLLEGQRAPLSWSFSYGEDAELQYAGGVLATPERVVDYPRIGAQAGFERLEANDHWWWGSMLDVARGGAATEPDAATTAEDEPATPPDGDAPVSNQGEPGPGDLPDGDGGAPYPGDPIVVTIIGVEEELFMLTDVDGTVWLIPGYAFTDDADGRYSVPAIPDDLLQKVTPVTPEPLPVQEDEAPQGAPEPAPDPTIDPAG